MNKEKSTATRDGQIGKKDSSVKKSWTKPSVTEISRFSILSLSPTVSVTENSTFRAKSA
jgi:hypothetical protein